MEHSIENIYSKFHAAKQNVCTDTRNISEGCLFFALRGENFNGNDFGLEAINKGAAFVIMDEDIRQPNSQFIIVKNVLETLQKLANHHRKQLDLKVIALTGSNGKTTTKELIHSVLNEQYKTYATRGNLNNHIGVPLTLLALTPSHEFAVVEMGANHAGEIELLCKIAEPDHGLITNIGKAHLEGFGSLEGVKKAKGEMYDFLRSTNGKIFLNRDNPVLKEMIGDYKNIFTYGEDLSSDIIGEIVPAKEFLKVKWRTENSSDEIISSRLTGNYNFENILASVCIGKYFDVENSLIKKGIENYVPSNQRSQVMVKDGNTFILDFYNANPASMEAALISFDQNYSGYKLVILGDMLELGTESEKEHRYIIDLLKKLNFSKKILVGNIFNQFSNTLDAEFFKTSPEANEWIQKQKFHNASILIKGSRGLKMEKAIEGL